MTYISKRAGSFLGLENLDMIITIVCSEMHFGMGSCRVEARQLVCFACRLMGFCMMRSVRKGEFSNGL